MRAKLIALLVFPIFIQAQVKSPADFLGYDLGDKFTRHHRVVDYFNHVTENSEKVNLVQYGTTYEDRPLLLAYVSSQENIENIKQIREDNLKRAGIRWYSNY